VRGATLKARDKSRHIEKYRNHALAVCMGLLASAGQEPVAVCEYELVVRL
jgi:hypothetical protein